MLNRKFIPLIVTCCLFFLLFGIGSVQFEGFGSARVFFNLLSDNAFLIIAAVGMTFVILSGGIDLSVGAVIALTGVVCSVLISQYQWHPLLAFPVVLVGGTLFGAAMGAIIHYYRMQPFIVTLAGMFFARGLASVISEESIPIDHTFYNDFSAFGFEVFDGAWIGSSTIICLLVLLIAIVIAHYTRFGGRVYALGGDANSAALMGIPLAQTTIAIYAISSLLATLAGIIYSFYTFSGYSLAAVGVELDAIAAVVIGGTLLTGGYGYLFGTLIGVLIMGVVQTYISFDGTLSSWWTKIVIGLLLFCFIALQQLLVKTRNP
ncbi:galactofuranose ABC transporter, permease protein YjfF [Cellvibrio japonicus]|uniref:Putative ABC transporter permease protein n=1 Tax=Cellvibrio japonicus (strain Ueda107) TaxID=498211 RepID=B3PD64_CELJU|nr:galactofuranose ABC transporter, permease protein YjfF [Cellvibrio japonicus]ACE83346.1 putative ABC transporter permease protein [Cellvibrio japonicus Ueda107]QEI13329.1 sugar ABC transporter permease YjfF [Cellvibrio japonicus]QEI16903.1 sugar ABC transporter permease YjfF [Cellvibrio japonicus]QEI20481.1 sugar ABC transporter permease YjfF [Cellvibrio japonicus]